MTVAQRGPAVRTEQSIQRRPVPSKRCAPLPRMMVTPRRGTAPELCACSTLEMSITDHRSVARERALQRLFDPSVGEDHPRDAHRKRLFTPKTFFFMRPSATDMNPVISAARIRGISDASSGNRSSNPGTSWITRVCAPSAAAVSARRAVAVDVDRLAGGDAPGGVSTGSSRRSAIRRRSTGVHAFSTATRVVITHDQAAAVLRHADPQVSLRVPSQIRPSRPESPTAFTLCRCKLPTHSCSASAVDHLEDLEGAAVGARSMPLRGEEFRRSAEPGRMSFGIFAPPCTMTSRSRLPPRNDVGDHRIDARATAPPPTLRTTGASLISGAIPGSGDRASRRAAHEVRALERGAGGALHEVVDRGERPRGASPGSVSKPTSP